MELFISVVNAFTVLIALAAALQLRRIKIQNAEREELLSDIRFLLQVEAVHCSLHKEQCGVSNRTKVRQLAAGTGASWSGSNTLSRIHRKLEVAGRKRKKQLSIMAWLPLGGR